MRGHTQVGCRSKHAIGHCGDESTGGFLDFYVHPVSHDRTNLNFRARYASGVYGDVEWYSTPQQEVASIYHLPADTRTIEAVVRVDTFYTGRVFDFFGRGSDDNNWARVADASITCGPYGHLVKMNKDFTELGDSGGPWFSEHRAAGIHSGECGSGDNRGAVFSKAGRLPLMLGVHVRTQ